MLNNLKEKIPNSTKRKIKHFLINCIDSLRYKLECCEFSRPSDIYAKKIIFICKGNVCRSAFAEYSMKKLTKGTQITVQSCGLKVNQGKNPPQEAIEIANKYSCDLSMHISKSIDSCNINEAPSKLMLIFINKVRLSKNTDLSLFKNGFIGQEPAAAAYASAPG